MRPHGIALGVLAGGAGRRTGGQDKGWIEVGGVPAVVALVEALRADVDAVLISANRNADRYSALGVVIADAHGDPQQADPYQGPLAGVTALLAATPLPLLLTVPVDIERVPAGCVAALSAGLDDGHDAVVAIDGDGVQPLVALYRCTLAASAALAFACGERSVRAWQQRLRLASARFPGERFGNRNTLAVGARAQP